MKDAYSAEIEDAAGTQYQWSFKPNGGITADSL